MEEAKLAILTDAKQEYSSQLINILKTSIYNGIKHLYDEAKKKCMTENRFDEVLVDFQEFLSQIRLWSQDMVEQEYKRIEKESDCDFIKELITAVFMSHMQILQVIGSGTKKQTQIDIPKPEHFIHKCYINAGREFYKNPMFFYDGPEVSPIERHRNIPHSETVIATTINETIRQLLPIRRILKSSLQEQDNEIEETKTHVSEPLKTESTKEEPLKTEFTKEEPLKTEFTKEEPLKTESTKEEPLKTESTKEEPLKTESTKEEPLKTESNIDKEPDVEPIEEINDDEREEIFIEDVPELSINDIEDIISKQEYVLPVEKKDEESEESEKIKKNIIADLDFQEVRNEKIQEPQVISNSNFEAPQVISNSNIEAPQVISNSNIEIKNVEMDNDDKQKIKKQKQEEQEIIIQKQDNDINFEKERIEKERIEKERIEKAKEMEKEKINEEITIDTNFEFDEEIDLNDGPMDIDNANISLSIEQPNQPSFKPTTAHKFKFF
jgi:hypothetical protein